MDNSTLHPSAPASFICADAETEQAVATAPTLPAGKVANLSLHLKAFALTMRALDRIVPRLTTELMLKHFTGPRRRRNSDYRRFLPTGAKRLVVDHRGHSLTGWQWGEAGPAVLLVHGWEDHCGAMLSLVQPLRERGFRVFAMDAPGHGLSPSMKTHLLDTGEALAALMKQVGRFQAIIAHSYGAAATTILLDRQPRWTPDHLTLVSPMQDIGQHLGIFAGIAGLSLAGWNRLRQRVAGLLGQSLDEISSLQAASRLHAPGLIIHDRDDPLIPYAVSARIAERWQAADLLATQSLGHRRILGCGKVVTALLDHIERAFDASADVRRADARGSRHA